MQNGTRYAVGTSFRLHRLRFVGPHIQAYGSDVVRTWQYKYASRIPRTKGAVFITRI